MTKLHNVYKAHRRYWNDGLTLREVAEEYGMDYSALHRRFTLAGLPTRPRGTKLRKVQGVVVRPAEIADEPDYLAVLRKVGETTVRNFAAEVGVTPQKALYHLKRLVARGEAIHVGGTGGQTDPRRYAAAQKRADP
jgi:hypothetical protein